MNESPTRPTVAVSMPNVMSVRGPILGPSLPAIGATNRIIIVIGSVRTPASIGE